MLLGLGIGLWLFTMLVIMPLTSAGVFALDLLEGKRSTILGYLGVGLLYSARAGRGARVRCSTRAGRRAVGGSTWSRRMTAAALGAGR